MAAMSSWSAMRMGSIFGGWELAGEKGNVSGHAAHLGTAGHHFWFVGAMSRECVTPAQPMALMASRHTPPQFKAARAKNKKKGYFYFI